MNKFVYPQVTNEAFSRNLSSLRGGDKGFALVVAVSLMVLLLLLAVSVMSLATVSIRQSDVDDAMMEARSNARMAMMIAIGELQESMGPDRRISARASTLAQDDRIGSSLASSNPRSWWVGVAGTNSNFGLNATTAVSSGNPAAKWLVSGLIPTATAAAQLDQAFDNPVIMFGEPSIDMALTGNQPLEAGIVRVERAKPGRIGGYAWIVDDEGLKAALVPAGTELVNTATPTTDSDLTPGAYDVSILEGMSSLTGNPLSNYVKIMSINDLALIGGGQDLAANKRFSFTTYSRGILCDVKNGGLKRDLTVAFEDDATFAEVFPRGAGNYTADYLCIDPAKLAASPELQTNGYIHWEVFKDHYNIKRHIKTHTDGTKYLDPVRYTKDGPFLGYLFNGAVNHRDDPATGTNGWRGSNFMAGRLGPHAIGDSAYVYLQGTYQNMMSMPYGNYKVAPSNPSTPKNHEEFKHSPVIPILQRFQTNAWMEQLNATTLRTHAQVWSSHYNAYNIALYTAGSNGGPRMLATPTIRPYSNALNRTGAHLNRFLALHENQNPEGDRKLGGYFQNMDMNSSRFTFHAKDPVMLMPGRSHVLGYENSAQIGVTKTMDGFLYNDKVKDLTVESVYRDMTYVLWNGTTEVYDIKNLPPSFDLRLRLYLMNTSMNHGVANNGGDNFELFQTFWAPFAWQNVGNAGRGKPGIEFDFGTVTPATLNENKMASLEFKLRSTREDDDSGIRPLVDANIRCLFGNSRWDSPLSLPLLASYSADNSGVANEMIMQMSTVDEPKGYSYWGAGHEPSFGYDRVILFDIPRSDLVSLGQLQHAGAGRFSYEPTYIVGNSYANPRLAQEKWKDSVTDTFSTAARGLAQYPIDGAFNLYDASYLVNEVLWDGYAFTTIPQVADNDSTLTEPAVDSAHFQDLVAGEAKLQNARYLPYVPKGSAFDQATLQMVSSKADQTGAFYHNAGHLLVDGAFNVNSTSVDAWEAFLSSTHSLPYAKMDEEGRIDSFEPTTTVRFPRAQSVFGEGMSTASMDENYWMGFRELNQGEVRSLAQAIVTEVEKRGPFLSMAEFVNRKLELGELGEAGALQAALDNTINTGTDSDLAIDDQGAAFPGQLLQGDILQALAPRMTVRSDVFVIRAYGESVSANSGEVLARAWCEAKVQRFPEPIKWGGSTANALSELSNPSSPFGREFRLISFRWLNPEEL